MTFDFHSYSFSFVARDSIQFPHVIPANVLRGGFGLALRRIACRCEPEGAHSADCVYARFFEPQALAGGPSGLRDHPRPFVFRARSLDGRTVETGDSFYFEMNVFEMRFPVRLLLEKTFSALAAEGLGPTRGRARLVDAEERLVSLDLDGSERRADGVIVSFLTPTELKVDEALAPAPEFAVLFARIRDRLSTLRALYGAGPLDIDFRAMAARAGEIAMVRSELQRLKTSRSSTRTGQCHQLGGFSGETEYAGRLDEYIPYLKAAQWTGVGRQTVWGKGELSVQAIRPDGR